MNVAVAILLQEFSLTDTALYELTKPDQFFRAFVHL